MLAHPGILVYSIQSIYGNSTIYMVTTVHNLKTYCLISGGGYTQVPYYSLLQRLSQSWIQWFHRYIKHACSNVWSVTAPYAFESLMSNNPDGSLREETAYEILTTGNSSEWRSGLVYFGEDKLLHAIHYTLCSSISPLNVLQTLSSIVDTEDMDIKPCIQWSLTRD